jgi:xanthine dehydrogenase accessory factor
MRLLDQFGTFLATHPQIIAVTLERVEGSSPREAGTTMLVAPDAVAGTIGGGQLEFLAIAAARQMLAEQIETETLDIPLGPEIGQCCGGRVVLSLRSTVYSVVREIMDAARAADEAQAQVFVFGAGHVGQALYRQLKLLPVAAALIDTRAEALASFAGDANARLMAVPESIVAEARPGAAFVVLTHDHGQDFLIASAALERGDATYVGMIGSKTKRAVFESQYFAQGGTEENLSKLVCPIGGGKPRDKRPEVIAAMTVAEILRSVIPSPRKAGRKR